LLVSGFGVVVVRFSDVDEQFGAVSLKVLVLELLVVGLFARFRVLEAYWVGLDFAKSVEVELAYKARQVVVLEIVRHNFRCESLRVFDDKGLAIIPPKVY